MNVTTMEKILRQNADLFLCYVNVLEDKILPRFHTCLTHSQI